MTTTPTPADQRSATRVVFPDPRRVELEEVIVNLRELGPHEVVVQARRSVISPGTELAHNRGDSLGGLRPPGQRPHQPFHPGYAMAGIVLAAGLDSGFAVGTSVLWQVPLYGEERSVAGCTRWVLERLADGRLVSGTITPDRAHAAYGVLDSEPDRHLTFLRLGGDVVPQHRQPDTEGLGSTRAYMEHAARSSRPVRLWGHLLATWGTVVSLRARMRSDEVRS
jgi:hypothetical protein